MTKNIFVWILFGFISQGISSQEDFAKNAFYLEVFGNGGAYSINYERALTSKVSLRVGFASWSISDIFDGEKTITTIPVLANYLIGNGNHKFESGLGFLFGSEKFSENGDFLERPNSKEGIFALTGVAGYRYQKPSGGILFRAGITPFINLGKSDYPDFNFSAGGSIGYAF